MAYETLHYIDGNPIRPQNADEIGFKIDWTTNPNEAELTVDTLILTNRAKTLVEEHWNTLGPFEGLPYQAAIDGFQLEYFIDFPEDTNWSDSEVSVNIKRRRALDKFMDDANGLSFELLNKELPNGIQNIFDVPYVIIRDNQGELLIMLLIATYNLTKALIEGVRDAAEAIVELIQATTPNAGVPPSIDTGDVIAAALKAAARIVYVIALLAALINLVSQILDILFPRVRYFKASYFAELLRQGCDYLGFEFESDLFTQYNRLTLLPVPLQIQNNSIFNFLIGNQTQSYTKGYPTANDSTPTLGSLITAVEQWFNAKTRVEQNGTVVRIERRDYWQNQSGITIDNTLNIQDRRETAWTHNWDECWKRYYMHYQTDFADIHTLDQIDGLQCEYSTEPINVNNPDLVNIKGLVEISIPFALGIRKNQLNFVETVVLTLAQFADSLVNFFGGNSNLASKITGRIGLLQISQQFYGVSKVLWTTGGKQPPNYIDIIGANAIYQSQHVINQVAENFKRIYQSPIPFSPQKFLNLLNNNYVFDQEGEQLELLDFNWINENREAGITYAIPSDEANNIQTIRIDA